MTCPICNLPTISPLGKSNILILTFEPEEEDVPAGRPFISRAGTVLKAELGRNKVDWRRMRLDCLWQHSPKKSPSQKRVDLNETGELNNRCLDHFMGELLSQPYDAVLLVGAAVTKKMSNGNVSDWTGIPLKSDYFDSLVMCIPDPKQVFAVPLGEVRLGIWKFCKEIRKNGYYE